MKINIYDIFVSNLSATMISVGDDKTGNHVASFQGSRLQVQILAQKKLILKEFLHISPVHPGEFWIVSSDWSHHFTYFQTHYSIILSFDATIYSLDLTVSVIK